MFSPDKLNMRERQFIRLYVGRMRDEYFLVRGVLDLMNPKLLGVKCILEATRLAAGMHDLHDDFLQQLSVLSVQRGGKKLPKDYPSTNELADLFTLSFFKVISTIDNTHKADAGLFSGNPNDWKKTIANMPSVKKTEKTDHNDTIFSAYLSAMQKLFPNIKWTDDFSKPGFWKLPDNSFSPTNDAAYDNDEGWFDEEDSDDDSGLGYWLDEDNPAD